MASTKAPPRMSGSEVLGCVELVVGAFKEAADLVARLSRKHKRRKGERNYHEILLFQVLEQGAKQVQQSYDEGFHRFGSAFKIGDDEARERLLCVAIETNADIVTSLQFACDVEKSQVDLVHLHETAITSRYDAIRTLNDLHSRLEKLRPLGSFSRFSPDSSVCGGDTRRNSLLLNAPEIRPGTLPPAVSVPRIPERSGLRRMLSVGGSASHRRAISDDSQGLRTTSSQVSIVPPALQPAPLYFNNHPAYPITTEAEPRPVPTPIVTHVRSQSTASETKKPTKAGTNKWEDTKDHPDLPDFQFLKKQKETMKQHTRAHSHTSSPPSKHDSIFSLPSRDSWDTQTTKPTLAPFTYPANLPTPPQPPVHHPITSPGVAPAGVVPMTLVTDFPAVPHHAQHPSLSRPLITSPIPEDPADTETNSVTSRDYDAASVYSQPAKDEQVVSPSIYTPTNDYSVSPCTESYEPCTPLTDASSHGRSSVRSSHSSSPSAVTTPSTSGRASKAPSMHRSDTVNTSGTSSPSYACTTISALERQMIRADDGTWYDVTGRDAIHADSENAPQEQTGKVKEKAAKKFRAFPSTGISSSSPMSLQLGNAFGINIGSSPLKKGHSRSRTADSITTALPSLSDYSRDAVTSGSGSGCNSMGGLTRTVSTFSQDSGRAGTTTSDKPNKDKDKDKDKDRSGFWHLRKASKGVMDGLSPEEKKQRLREFRERKNSLGSFAFAA